MRLPTPSVANIENLEPQSLSATAPAPVPAAPTALTPAPTRRLRKPRASRKRQPLAESEQAANIPKPPRAKKPRLSRKRALPAPQPEPDSDEEEFEFDFRHNAAWDDDNRCEEQEHLPNITDINPQFAALPKETFTPLDLRSLLLINVSLTPLPRMGLARSLPPINLPRANLLRANLQRVNLQRVNLPSIERPSTTPIQLRLHLSIHQVLG